MEPQSDRSIVARVGRTIPEVETFELPSSTHEPLNLVPTIVIPAIPPYCGENEDPCIQQCPYCHSLIPIDENGLSYCPRCSHILFVSDGKILPEAEGGSDTPTDPRCPSCGATSDDPTLAWDDVTIPLFGFDLRRIFDGLFCRGCGQVVKRHLFVIDGYQFHSPNDPIDEDCVL